MAQFEMAGPNPGSFWQVQTHIQTWSTTHPYVKWQVLQSNLVWLTSCPEYHLFQCVLWSDPSRSTPQTWLIYLPTGVAAQPGLICS